MTNSERKIAVVTGATRGIGREIARELAKDFHVILAARDADKGRAAARELPDSEYVSFDQTSDDGIANLVSLVTDRGVDVLVNNAGASFSGFSAELAAKTLETNFRGMMRLTDRVLPRLRPGARIVLLSSGMGQVSCLSKELQREVLSPTLDRAALLAFARRFVDAIARDEHRAEGWPGNAYSVSKVAMNGYVRILARDLAPDPRGILVNSCDPGWVRTDMGGASAPRSVAEGARTPVWLAKLPPGGPNGGFFRDEKPIAW